MSVYTHRVDNMAEGSAGMTWVVCACKQNDLPETIIHRLWNTVTRTFGWLYYFWHLMGCRDLIRSQLWYNSVCDDQSRSDGLSWPDQKSIMVWLRGRWPKRDLMAANSIHLRVASNEKNTEKKMDKERQVDFWSSLDNPSDLDLVIAHAIISQLTSDQVSTTHQMPKVV